jgi:hypothetical protein
MKIRILIVLIASVFALSANSATLVIDSGQLMGATDVDVGGQGENSTRPLKTSGIKNPFIPFKSFLFIVYIQVR